MNNYIKNASNLENTGANIIRYGLVLILIWIGCLKFTSYEAEGIKPLVMNSPLLSWGYKLTSVTGFAKLLGITEITLGALIATRRLWPKVSALGSIGSILMFIITISFIITTPAAWQPDYSFPYLSPMPGQFLLKDILLLGAAVFTAGEALSGADRLQYNQSQL